MFPFFVGTCCGGKSMSRQDYQTRKLEFLKWIRDDMQTRLAGLNATIASIEQQLGEVEDDLASDENA